MAIFRRRKQEDSEEFIAADSSGSDASESSIDESSISGSSPLAPALTAVRDSEKLSEDVWDEIERHLLSADLGIATARRLLEPVKAEATSPDEAVGLLRQALIDDLSGNFVTALSTDGSPAVWLVVGVNGVGKNHHHRKASQARK